MSTPRTEKDSMDEKSDDMVCGASSMQGWRINQEVRNGGRRGQLMNRRELRVYDQRD